MILVDVVINNILQKRFLVRLYTMSKSLKNFKLDFENCVQLCYSNSSECQGFQNEEDRIKKIFFIIF